jgi:SNF2 family DNA or RNA helicase
MLTAASPRDVQPKHANIVLKPHQLAMLKRCKDIEASRIGIGIMKDPPGAGKTYVILSLLLQDVDTKNINILVVPQNIYTQWIDAINIFSKNIKYAKYIEYNEVSSLYFKPSFKGINLVVTTPLYFNIIRDALETYNLSVNRVIIDEVDSVSFLCQKPLTCKNIWMVSASFDRQKSVLLAKFAKHVENEQKITCQCNPEFVLTGFPLPSLITKDIICYSNYLDQVLFDMFSPYELQAANALDYSKIKLKNITIVATNEKDALELLMKDLIITIEKEETNISNYDLIDDLPDETSQQRKLIARTDSIKNLEYSKHRLKTISDRLSNGNMCVICYEEFNNTPKVITFCCQNSFCEFCISTWYMKNIKCPYCRAICNYDKHVLIKQTDEEEPEQPATKTHEQIGKMDHLKNLLLNEVGSKVIIFSDFSKVFKEIANILRNINSKYTEFDGGNIANIDRDINEYKFGDTQILMCNSNFFGCGMNLEFTSDIIFLHKMEEHMYNQVIGRAQRPGRTAPLNVFRLLNHNEL